MSRSDKIALALSLLAILFSYLVADRIFERMAHLEDEMAYVWQAQAIAGGKLTVPSPPEPKSFLWPFVVDYNGQRFGKYPIAWPALLSLGERIGQRSLVNPLLAGLAIWLIYRLGKRIFGETVGLLAAGLTLTSPFFLVNSGSLLSHPLGLVLSTGFALAWLAAFTPPTPSRPWLAVITAGCALGLLALTRPLTAFAVAVPFMLHGLVLFFKRDGQVRRHLLVFIAIVFGIGSLHFAWQYAVTGDALLNPYTLWWPYDKIGFGPGHGHNPAGHTLRQAWLNTKFSIKVGTFDLYGWPKISWLFLPVGLVVAIRQRTTRLPALLISGVFITLVAFYLAYWVGASLYGPRYYYEALYSLSILSAAGIAWLAGWPTLPEQTCTLFQGWQRWRPLAVTALLTLLVGFNLVFYLPARLQGMTGLYGVSRANLEPFLTETAQQITPALIIVHPQEKWIEYGTLLDLENPFLDTPFIFVYSRSERSNQLLASLFPDRAVYHYYADEPYKFYTTPRHSKSRRSAKTSATAIRGWHEFTPDRSPSRYPPSHRVVMGQSECG